MLTVFTGDDWDIIVTLKKDGVAYDVSTATEIKASIVDSNSLSPSVVVAPVVLSIGATGADWANGVVVAEIPNATTAPLSPQTGWVEVQVEIGGKKQTWPRQQIDIKTGTIA